MPQSTMLTSRVERLVAGGRVVLASFSLLAIYLDPAEPAKFADLTYGVLALYVAFSIGVAAWTWPRVTQPLAWTVTTHVIDLAFFSALIYFTEGPTSPFFLYFIFALFSAMLRLHLRGLIWTAVAAVALFIIMGVYAAEILHDPAFELNRFLVRSVYLVVVASLLTHLAKYEENIRRELRSIAAWPLVIPGTVEELIGDSLQRAAALLHVPRVLVGWSDGETPRLFLGRFEGASFECTEEVGDFAMPLLHEEGLKNTSIVRFDKSTSILQRREDGTFHWTDALAVDVDLREAFAIESALVVRFEQRRTRGFLIYLDRRDLTHEDMTTGEIAATIIGARLEQFREARELERAAVIAERGRLGRDLHDSFLQSLTGTALQLELLRRTIDRDPAGAQSRLVELQRVVAQEQHDLRSMVQKLQREFEPEMDLDLVERLAVVAVRFRQQWDIGVDLDVVPLVRVLTNAMKHEIYSIVSEAMANAVRHGAPHRVRVAVRVRDEDVYIRVSDDGRGFPFIGTFDLKTLSEMRRGPVALRERIASLSGDLVIESSPYGATLQVTIPLVVQGARHVGASSIG
jgi:signal transduction histidine kinase